MALWARVTSLWRNLVRGERFERDLNDEVRAAYDLLVDERVRAGMSAEDARRLAALELGGIESVKQQVRDNRAGASVDALLQDVRYAARSLASRPLVSGVAVVSLALGIGVNTAIFSVFERLVLRRLPIPAADELVNVTISGPRPGFRSSSNGGGLESVLSYPLFRDLERAEGTGLTSVFAHRDFGAAISVGGQTTGAQALLVSGSYFPALQVVPRLGRLLGPSDDRVEDGHPVVVVSHAYWTTRLSADPSIVGSSIRLNSEPMTIVGVAPEDFMGTVNSEAPAFFVPLAMARIAGLRQDWNGFQLRNDHWLYVSGRLAPNVSRPQAERLLASRFASITRDIEFPVLRGGMGVQAREAFLTRQITLEEGARGRNPERAEARRLGSILFIITGLVLAIAAANVANLLLARGTDRAGELALRQALGASSTRLIRLLLLEAVGLGLVGGFLGLLVARGSLAGLVSILPPTEGARLDAGLNLPVLLFSLSLGLMTGLLFGIFPAVHCNRTGAAAGLHQQSGRASSTRTVRHARTIFAIVQLALATALLSQAGLFVLSLLNIARADTGMRRDGLVMFTLSTGATARTPTQNAAAFEEIEASLRATPGVLSVSASSIPVLAFNGRTNNVTIGETKPMEGADRYANYAEIGSEYFATVGIPLLRGREFTRADDNIAPKVAVVNEAFLKKFNLDSSILGMRMARGEGGNRPLDIEIVGIVADARYSDLREAPPPQFFLPYRQGAIGSLTFYVHIEPASTRAVIGIVPALISRVDSNLLVTGLQTMNQLLRQNSARERALSMLSLSFAGLATLLAAVGLYAVLAYGVARRAKEMGIRLALGATPKQIVRLVFGDVGRMTVAGCVFGGAMALALGRLSQSILFGVSGDNVQMLLATLAVVLIVALVAAALPARRAAGVNPAQILRAE